MAMNVQTNYFVPFLNWSCDMNASMWLKVFIFGECGNYVCSVYLHFLDQLASDVNFQWDLFIGPRKVECLSSSVKVRTRKK